MNDPLNFPLLSPQWWLHYYKHLENIGMHMLKYCGKNLVLFLQTGDFIYQQLPEINRLHLKKRKKDKEKNICTLGVEYQLQNKNQ